MKRFIKYLIFVTLIVNLQSLSQQYGNISGKLSDSTSAEPVVWANIMVSNTNLGTTSDLSGKFEIKNIPTGTYDIIVSCIGYSRKVLKNVKIEENKTFIINLLLTPELIQSQEVVIEANTINNSELAILQAQKKANRIQVGISSEQIKKSSDVIASDVMRKIIGVSIVDNKYIYIRGVSDRYNNAFLNGVRLSSTEVDKKSFAIDLIPANFIENIFVAKSSTPDIPGDFAGGVVQINTNDFPTERLFKFSFGSSWNALTTNKNFTRYTPGPKDWLGYDNNYRTIPKNFPETLNGLSQENKNELALLLNNDLWSLKNIRAPLNSNFQICYGNSHNIFEKHLGYIFNLTYRKSYSNANIGIADYDDSGLRYQYSGNKYKDYVMLGGLANVSLKFSNYHKIGFKGVFSNVGEDAIVMLEGLNNFLQNQERLISMQYVSRKTLNLQIEGEHYWERKENISMQWRVSGSTSENNEPDHRRIIYAKSLELPDSKFEAQIPYNTSSPNSSSRFYSNSNDNNRNFEFSISFPIYKLKIKLGGLLSKSERIFKARNFVYTMPVYNPVLTQLDINNLFKYENIGHITGLQFDEYYDRRNRYEVSQDLLSSFIMLDLKQSIFKQNLRIVGGFRIENSHQKLFSGNLQNEDINTEFKSIDFLPSINTIFNFDQHTNLKLAYSRSINKPELREIAPFSFYDFSTKLTTYGNPNLKNAIINNYDVYLEFFPALDELISIGYFYKYFINPIEKIVVPTVALAGERTFKNAPKAINKGFELEIKKNLAFLGTYLEYSSVSINYSKINSIVVLDKIKRPMQGQSPYIINLGLYFTEPELKTSINLFYNKYGRRISEAATVYTMDVIEKPGQFVDIVITQPLFNRYEIKLSGKDILQNRQVFIQDNKEVKTIKTGATYSISISIKI